MKAKKITLATIKSFIRKNNNNLYINVKSRFDGMHDCCMPQNDVFVEVRKTDSHLDRTLGIQGAWFVGSSRDYFYPYNKNGFIGYQISNCCGRFVLVVKE